MIPLRPYQQELVDNIRRAIGQGRHSVCAVLGCGGGKSVIQGNIAASATARGNRVLFVVHRKELCQQITNTFAACGVDFSLCTVGMVQTVCRRLAKTPEPKLILVDEAHHILSQSYLSILQHFPGAVVLGFTATPQRMNEGGLGAVFEELIESVSTEWLIQNHYLAPYKYYGVQLADASKLHTKRGDYDKAEIEALMNKRAIFGSAVENWLQLAKGKQTIVYCSSIATSEGTAAAFREQGINDGTTPQAQRQAAVEGFRRGEVTVLCNVDLFGEGFDVPDCDCVVLMRPTKSLTLHIQQSMRSMRTNPNNPDKVALILDHVGNFTRHGLPDDVREWSLESKAKKKKQESASSSARIALPWSSQRSPSALSVITYGRKKSAKVRRSWRTSSCRKSRACRIVNTSSVSHGRSWSCSALRTNVLMARFLSLLGRCTKRCSWGWQYRNGTAVPLSACCVRMNTGG